MDQVLAQVAVAALADAQHLRLAAGGVLARSQTKPGRQVPPSRESAAVAYGRQQSRSVDYAYAGDPG